MGKWGIRLAGLLMLLAFTMAMTAIYKQLVAMQRMQQPAATSR